MPTLDDPAYVDWLVENDPAQLEKLLDESRIENAPYRTRAELLAELRGHAATLRASAEDNDKLLPETARLLLAVAALTDRIADLIVG